jgi:hypothetical protein
MHARPDRHPVGSGCEGKVDVAIIGGGIGGLATALHLLKRGIRVKVTPHPALEYRHRVVVCKCWLAASCATRKQVYEKDSSFRARRQGYGLTLQQGGLALSTLGLGNTVAEAASWSQSHFVFDADGRTVAFWGPTWWERARSILRQQEGSENEGTAEILDDPAWRRLAGHNLHIPRQARFPQAMLFRTGNEGFMSRFRFMCCLDLRYPHRRGSYPVPLKLCPDKMAPVFWFPSIPSYMSPVSYIE